MRYVPRKIKCYLLAFYDEHGCYDESRYDPWELNQISYAFETIAHQEPNVDGEYEKLFVYFEDGESYEIKLTKD